MLWLCLAAGCESQRPATIVHHEAAAGGEIVPEPLYIQLTGTKHRWQAEYLSCGSFSKKNLVQSGPDLHVPVDTNVVLILKSTDYIYMLAIPEFGMKEIAVPELEFRMTFRPMEAGQHPLIGEELCGGVPGRDGPGQIIVEPRAEFLAWLRRASSSF